MPIEIAELLIRANVSEQPNKRAAGNNVRPTQTRATDPTAQQVKKSLEALLETIKRKNER